MQPVKASGWFNTDLTSEERNALLKSGIVPVNDKFFEIWGNRADILLLRGGRGGGKSESVVDKLIDNAKNDEYFKCYYGRKIFDTVRGSCFETLVASIEKFGLQGEFSYSTANTSSMVITHKNGNRFIPFGSDKADKLKSIKDPSVIWCEEFDQFEEEDFMELYPTLRTTKAHNQFIGSFNTHKVYEAHWLLKVFFPDLYRGDDKADFDFLKDINVQHVFVNFNDNYFINQEQYLNQLRLASGGNDLILQGIAHGAWGVEDNKNPWLYNFNTTHVVNELKFKPDFPVYLSFDFNNDPFACVAFQMSPNMGQQSSFVHGLKEFSGMMKVEEMCNRIKTTYPNSIIHITGDRSGQNEDIGRNQTLYQMIAGYLGVSKHLLNLNNSNLEHSDSRLLLNALFANYPNIYISREGCPNLIRQCQAAKVDPESKKPSQLLKDRGQYKNDEFDAMRYFFQTYFNDYAKKTYFQTVKR